MKLAAIDIGSNAIRLQVSKVLQLGHEIHFKKLEYVRFPLRLGHDAFTLQRISDEKCEKFIQLMEAFKILISLYEVDTYLAYATSAMRESANGENLVAEVKKSTGLEIQIIDGEHEAATINVAVMEALDDGNYLHIDVGGGSTELTFLSEGRKTCSKSFPIGSVRRLEHFDLPEVWVEMKEWIASEIPVKKKELVAVGTGGNINKLFDLAGKKPGKTISRSRLHELRNQLAEMPLEERLFHLRLNPDRADVIVPAADIYHAVMKWSDTRNILVPDVGLKDGMLRHMYQQLRMAKTD